ncbi:MAG: hypothetical protein KZQ57_03580 [gamma proteobacterium symbiont of Lucinoma myriamae]|nr:hypothetical protein [gamma proteobacterium symbiont of Lucinoma myriamae]
MGSEFFLNQSGFYDTIQADRAMPDFIAFNGSSSRDKGWWNADPAIKPNWSRPFCKEWYENRLRQKIIDSYTRDQ